jgi:hypothetical protein
VVGLIAQLGVRAGLLGAATAILLSRASIARRAAGIALCASLFGLAQTDTFRADVVFAHAHNLIAIGLWLAWRRRTSLLFLVPILSFGVGAWCLLSGPLPPWLQDAEYARWHSISFAELGQALSLSANPAFTLRLVLFFAFAQSVHYGAWLRLIPEEARRRSAPRSYEQSFRALRADVGPYVLWIALFASLVLVSVALANVHLARDLYLGLAYAHGHIELVAASLLFMEGALPPKAPSRVDG